MVIVFELQTPGSQGYHGLDLRIPWLAEVILQIRYPGLGFLMEMGLKGDAQANSVVVEGSCHGRCRPTSVKGRLKERRACSFFYRCPVRVEWMDN